MHNFYDLLEELQQTLQQSINDEINQEITNTVIIQYYKDKGWNLVFIKNKVSADDDWCLENLKGNYKILGHYCYFEDKNDAVLFALRYA